ncbi:alpha-amylase family glycosyl hydrolase [Deinococcus yavapaiensis]|uniref:Alpha amylase catalytic subunit n=1 Tax=Deinococcus yavapaiensis KR-236 TaxID=694435 RepID=A0A318SCQ5_9DEIO|nr:alpha-amylase family glycosyl hydrolase [Deinococcus yavapaiensis]PYE54588.1 alpha amylase catalytic subunit [Deinococcus yavapaiensis KR-236]
MIKLPLVASRLLLPLALTLTSAATTTTAADTSMLPRKASTAANTWWANAAFYQVFVRSFQDSDGDGIGDFKGLTSRLDYLKNLGVNALWLMPIFPSPSYHGYDVTDYQNVNSQYGTLADFDALLKAAHAKGFKVMLDWVPNHTSRNHPWFQAARDPSSDKHDWYLWRTSDPGWRKPWGEPGTVWFPVTTGAQTTSRVVFPGTIQKALGGREWDPNGDASAATQVAPGVFEFVARLPEGSYEYKTAVGGSWSENYGAGDRPDGPNIRLAVPAGGAIVKFVYDANKHTVRDSLNNPGEVKAPDVVPARSGSATATSTATNTQYYYAAFWEGMPDLNWRNPGVKAAMNDAAAFWLKRGVDGFRVDAARYIVENKDDNLPDNADTLAWTKDFTRFVKSVKPDAAVVGEVWTDLPTVAKYFLNGQGEDLAFNFDLRDALLGAVRGGSPDLVQTSMDRVTASYPTSGVDAIFTTNHDMTRPSFASTTQAKTAASLLLTLPGTPFLYYGQEIGMPNGSGNADEEKRTPMRWTTQGGAGFTTGVPWYAFSTNDPNVTVQAQQANAASLLSHYRRLLSLRSQIAALRSGGYVPLQAKDGVLSFVRSTSDAAVVVIVNLGASAKNVTVDLSRVPVKIAGPVMEAWSGRKLANVDARNQKAYPVAGLEAGGLAILTFPAK